MSTKSLVTLLALTVLTIQSAWALTPENRVLIETAFAKEGTVAYELMAPLGTTELGVALVEKGTPDYQLLVLKVLENGTLSTVLSETFPKTRANIHPLTLLYNSQHLLTYKAREWIDEDGNPHLKGDLAVRDIGDRGDLKVLFQVRDVIDLQFSSDGVRSTNNILSQPADHFLNRPGNLPVKHRFHRLAFDQVTGEYGLFNHLDPMTDSANDDASNKNNRAILFYDRGDIQRASRLLSEAWTAVGYNPVIIQTNQVMVKGEIDDLNAQNSLGGDDALLYFWIGDWKACLRVLAAREEQGGLNDYDLAMTGICYAYLMRWPEADYVSVELNRREFDYVADYFSELARIASFQNFKDSFEVEGRYLQALELADNLHPGLATGKARLLRQQGEFAAAQHALEDYLWTPGIGDHNLSEAIAALSAIFHSQRDDAGLLSLEILALAGPVTDLTGYVSVVDYRDLSSAMVDVAPAEREGIDLPDSILELMRSTQ